MKPAVMQPYRFAPSLLEGVILGRPNRFIMDVEANGEVFRAHCPVVTRIGDIDTAGRPCLFSASDNPSRKFAHTVEALSFDEPEKPFKRWVGLNQTASNRYIEHFLRTGAFGQLAPHPESVRREVKVGSSRLDFLIDEDLYLEVKTPLRQLECEVPASVARLPQPKFSSTDRALRHLEELARSMETHERAIILYCMYYQNHGFHFYHGTTYDEVVAGVAAARAAGVELWQATLEQDAHEVRLVDYAPMEGL